MTHFQVRIHRPWSDVSGVVIKLGEKAEGGFAFQHEADQEVSRTHVHVYLFNLNLKYDAISDRVKKLKLKGNEDFAISTTCGYDKRPLDVSGAWTYGTERNALRPVWVEKFSPVVLESLQDGARQFYAKRGNTGPQASPAVKAKKLNKYGIVKEIAANVLCPEFLKLEMKDRIKTVRDATKLYMVDNVIFCDSKRLVEYVECVMMDLDDESFMTAVNRRLNYVFYGVQNQTNFLQR